MKIPCSGCFNIFLYMLVLVDKLKLVDFLLKLHFGLWDYRFAHMNYKISIIQTSRSQKIEIKTFHKIVDWCKMKQC